MTTEEIEKKIQALILELQRRAYQDGYERGVRDQQSRAQSVPGRGDMGG